MQGSKGRQSAEVAPMNATEFLVSRHDLQECKFIETKLPDANALAHQALLLKVERFAFTANNITYAALGDQLNIGSCFQRQRVSASFLCGALAKSLPRATP
jgi:hypothetical protein